MVKHRIILGDVNTADYNAVVDGSQSFGSAERLYEAIDIAGKNGALIIDGGKYSNVKLEYKIMFYTKAELEAFRSAVSRFKSYERLEDTHHSDEYRMAKIDSLDIEMKGINNRWGIVQMDLNCKPQRFLKSGENTQTFTTNGDIWNPTPMEAYPMFRVYGYGTFKVGNTTLTIANYNKTYIDIDCELMDCFNGSANLNSYVTLSATKFPSLPSGKTGITFSGNITKVEVIPRWWRL